MARQLEHVVGVARLGGVFAELVVELVGSAKAFAVAVAAVHVSVMMDHALPEKLGRGFVGSVARELVATCESDEFRDLRVGVESLQVIFATRQRLEHGFVMKAARESQVLFVAG